MAFRRRRLSASISFVISAGLLALHGGQKVQAQANSFDCRPNADGDGWVCDSTGPTPAPVSPERPDRFPGSAPATPVPAPASPATARAAVTPATSGLPAAEPPPPGRGNELDWVDRERLTQDELAGLPDSCCGAFIEPARELIDPLATGEDAETLFRTESGFTQLSDDTITIEGPVTMQQGLRTVSNDGSTTISGENDSVLMEGNVLFREPGLLLRGSSTYIDSEADQSRVEDATYVLHQYGSHGTAQNVVFSSESNLLTIENGEFSRCEPDTNFWRLSARSIVLDQNAGLGYARGATLRIANVPVFYYPFTLTFPLQDERVSGFLAPSAGSTREGGFDFELPYYFNLAPHYDATLTPRLISERGEMLSGEARYLSSWSMNTLNASLLPDDRKFDPDASPLDFDSPPQEDRWFVGYEHLGTIGDNWFTYIDYNAVSDYAYFEDLGSSGLNVASRTHLNRQGQLGYADDLFQASVGVQRFQILDPLLDPVFTRTDLAKPFDRLPQFEADADLPLPASLRFTLHGEFNSFDRDLDETLLSMEQVDAGALVKGDRINLEPSLSLELRRPGWFFIPTASYKHIEYRLEDQAQVTEEDPEVGVPVFSLDTGLVFERSMRLGGGYIQTLEPRLYYLNAEYEDQSTLPLFDASEFGFSFNQLFRDDRFSGGDRVADADQLTAALTSRILDTTGRERARVSIGQIEYFDDRLVSLDSPLQNWVPHYSQTNTRSALVGEFGYAFSDLWRFQADVQYDEDTREVDEGSLRFNFRSRNEFILNVAYRYRDIATLPDFLLSPEIDSRIKQTDVSTVVPLNSNWRILGRWNYDHGNSRNLETFAGVEFSNCCTTIRLVAREWANQYELFLPEYRPDRGVFFQFTLHGLGNLSGGGLSNMLNASIAGFEDPYEP